jgi:hypothetical protein
MPHWEDELRTLLASLGVSLEDVHEDTPAPVDPDEIPTDSMVRALEAQQQEDGQSDDGDEFSMVNREMEATVREVARLASAGRLEPALRDDVLHVLRALTRTAPPGIDAEDWRYTSAAAILHFCRIVLRLANELTRPE